MIEEPYKLMENIRDLIADKFIKSYGLRDVYRVVVYATVYAALQTEQAMLDMLKPLEDKIPPVLVASAKRELVAKLGDLISHIKRLISAEKPIVHSEADLKHVINIIKNKVRGVEHVLAYDGMSLIEQLVISAFLKTKGMKALFLDVPFLNPIGVTRYMTQQLHYTGYPVSLRGVAIYIAKELNASSDRKNALIDLEVHETGLMGIEVFVDRLAIERIAEEILEACAEQKTLVFSDHGYDVIASLQEKYLYVVHGSSGKLTPSDRPVLLLSRVAPFMLTYRG